MRVIHETMEIICEMDDLQENELALLREDEQLTKGLTHANWPGHSALMGSSAWVEQAALAKKEIIGVLKP